MSSYIVSAFELERGRLQGIVNQCSRDLENAISKVQDQMDYMLEKEQQQKEKDASYESVQEAALLELLKRIEEEKETENLRREALNEQLRMIEIQIEAYHRINGGMENAMERQEQLWRQYREQSVSVDAILEQMRSHGEKVLSEMRQIAEDKRLETGNKSTVMEAQFTVREKGISLKTVAQPEKEEKRQEDDPLSCFVGRLTLAAASPNAARLPSIAKLKKEFEAQPEYAKTAFAVKNSGRLEELLTQLERMEERKRTEKEKWGQLVKHYQAICLLVGEEPEQKYLEDIRCARAMQEQYRKYCQVYQAKKEQLYISQAVSSVMERYGIIMTEPASGSTREISMKYSLDENASLRIESGQNKTVSMEVSGVYGGEKPTLEEKRKSVASAKKFCSLIKHIEKDLREEYGILLKDDWIQEPSEESICMEQSSHAAGQKKSYTEKKAMADFLH